MDPLAHTLIGATLAEAGLKKKTALATGTLIIGANIPDVDALAMFWGNDFALFFRRGWTHGILALLIWPFLLTGVMMLYDQIRRWWHPGLKGTRASKSPPLKPLWLLSIAFIAVWSHPFLDWLNVYGVRLLMPFSGTWFYGDTLFIIDPWVWLLAGAAVVFARSDSWPGLAGWIMLGIATSALVIGTAVVPAVAKGLWIFGILAIVVIRLSGWYRGKEHKVAILCLMAFTVYLLIMFAGSRITVFHAEEQLSVHGVQIHDVMADPLPARMFERRGVAVTEQEYILFNVHWINADSFEIRNRIPRIREPDPIIRSAMASPEVKGLINWIRYPHFEVREVENGWQVLIRDLRFVGPRQMDESSIGMAIVELDTDLNPR